MTLLPAIEPKATMEEAWAEKDRLWAEGTKGLWIEAAHLWAKRKRLGAEGKPGTERERLRAERDRLVAAGDRLEAEGDLVVILTAQALFPDIQVIIDWDNYTVTRQKEA